MKACNRCGFDVPDATGGDCKQKCPHCGWMYPHGDCSD